MAGGGGGGKTAGGQKKARIEIIPLIDVIFFLLATFILFTLSLNKSEGIAVELPQAETPEARETAGSVTISVTEGGGMAWNKDDITLDEFIPRLQAYKATFPDGRVLINGDANAPFATVFQYVINEVRKAGFQKVFIETKVRAAKAG